MKKILLFILFFGINQMANSQLMKDLPFDQDGKIIYAEVVSQPGDEAFLHLKAKEFFANCFKSSNDVIQLDDKDSKSIIAKGSSKIFIDIKKQSVPVILLFTLKIESKEGRYRYEINSLKYNAQGNEFSAESLFSKEKEVEYNKSSSKSRLIADQYRDKTKNVIDLLIHDLKKSMSTQTLKKNDW